MPALGIEHLHLGGTFLPCCKCVTRKHIPIHLQPGQISGNCEQHSYHKTAEGSLPPSHAHGLPGSCAHGRGSSEAFADFCNLEISKKVKRMWREKVSA